MLYIPEWFSEPAWVRNFDDLAQAIGYAYKKRQPTLKRRKTLRSRWRAAKGCRA